MCYLPVEEAITLMPKTPSHSPVLKNLTFIYEETLNRETEFGGSDFGGYPTLRQRNDSYDIRESMNIHCGYVKDSYFELNLSNYSLLWVCRVCSAGSGLWVLEVQSLWIF